MAYAVDDIRERFGSIAVVKASSLAEGGIAIDRSTKLVGTMSDCSSDMDPGAV
ncbi:hypothetical protein [Ammoniphilus sp. 3BR4]|uniref:hypothetical protein n=1 Tax=Ammoniphilus sp. 3BR4 TaxID=3158265 RepID=UPI0034661D1C